MHIKEHGTHIYVILWSLLFLVLFFGPRDNVQNVSEVIMEKPSMYVHTAIKAVEVPITITHKEPIKIPPRYGFTDKEIYLLTVLLCGSAKRDGDGEYDFDFEKEVNAKQVSLVLNVVMNRVESKKFPDTVSEVIWAQNQFSYMPHWKKGLPKVNQESYEIVKDWCVAYDAHDTSIVTIPKTHLYFSGNGKYNKSSERW